MKTQKFFFRFEVIIFFLLLWEVLSFHGLINSLLFPPPSKILISLKDLLISGELLQDVATSFQRVIVGFSISLCTAIPLALLLGTNKKLHAFVSPFIDFIKPIPPIAWIPIAIIWFGIGNNLAYFVTMIASFFPIFTNTFVGVENVPKEDIEVAKCFGANKRMQLFDIVIPSSLPYIFSGIRVGLGIAWMSIVAAEMVTSISGLGYLITANQQMLRLDRVFVSMIAIGFVGMLMDNFVVRLRKKVVRWK